MTRLLLFVAFVTAATPAFACPPPRPGVVRLTLATPDGTTIPADGALLVTRGEDYDTEGDAWTVRTTDGTAVAVTIEPLADGLERWKLAPGDRDLELVDAKGAVVRRFHQSTTTGAALAAPKLKRLVSSADGKPMRFPGVAASHVRLDLSSAPPSRALFLLADMPAAGTDPIPWLALPPSTHHERTTPAHKSCSPGPAPVTAGMKLRFRWLTADGRLSKASAARTVALAKR